MRTIFAEYNPGRNSIDVYTSADYMLRIDCWEAEKNLRTTPGSDCAYNEIMFLREITHTVNAFNDMADVIRLYSKKPEAAEQRLANLLSEVMYEDSESV